MLTVCVEGIPCPGPAWASASVSARGGCVSLEVLQGWARSVLAGPEGPEGDVYFLHNGRKLQADTPVCEGVVRVVPRLRGGKGGFGSMLRAIGAQIEKTTNREACRDLSGRRLRDINEEKRLKNWISKKADREREAVERKQKKLEKLRAEPKIEFKDKKYEEERSKLTEVVHDSVEKGFQASTSGASSSSASRQPVKRKGFMLEEEEFSDSSVSSSGESEADGDKAPKRKAQSESESDSDSPDSDEPSPAKRQHLTEAASTSEQSADSSEDSSSEEEQPQKCA